MTTGFPDIRGTDREAQFKRADYLLSRISELRALLAGHEAESSSKLRLLDQIEQETLRLLRDKSV